MKIQTTLVIPDSHAEPEHSNERFDALGRLIADRRPDNIVQIGDFLTMDSFSCYDEPGTLAAEGRRVKQDVIAGQDAYYRMMSPVMELNKSLKRNRKKQYRPNGIWMLGNHEERASRYVNRHPELMGFFDYKELLPVAKDGWTVVPYRTDYYLNGVAFTHVPMNPKNNCPIAGKYVCARAAEIYSNPVVFGHTHVLQTHTIARNSEEVYGDQVRALNVGWFGDFQPHYITNSGARDWWSGVIMLHHFGKSKFDFETIAMERIKGDYL